MVMNILSATHILTVLAEFGAIFLLYCAFRDRSAWAKRAVIIILIALNILQHFLKSYIYPHMFGNGFGLENTAYNVCAFLILLSPFLHFGKSPSARQFLAFVGSISGCIAVIVPFWFFGKDITEPAILSEFIRFWLCHTMLCASSILPVLWGEVKFNHLDAWKFPFFFLGMLCALLLNDTIVLIATGDATAATGNCTRPSFGTLFPSPLPSPRRGSSWKWDSTTATFLRICGSSCCAGARRPRASG